jgi:hypothetical protein
MAQEHSKTQKKVDVCRLKPFPEDWWQPGTEDRSVCDSDV